MDCRLNLQFIILTTATKNKTLYVTSFYQSSSVQVGSDVRTVLQINKEKNIENINHAT